MTEHTSGMCFSEAPVWSRRRVVIRQPAPAPGLRWETDRKVLVEVRLRTPTLKEVLIPLGAPPPREPAREGGEEGRQGIHFRLDRVEPEGIRRGQDEPTDDPSAERWGAGVPSCASGAPGG